MPKYEITSPDGKKFEITAPEGATQEQVLSYAQSQWKAPKTDMAAEIANDPISQSARESAQPQGMLEKAGRWFYGDPNATTPERIAANPLTRFAMGAAAPVLGAGQLLRNMGGADNAKVGPFNNDSMAQLEQMKRAGGMEGTDVAGIAGQMLSPAALKASALLGPSATAARRIGKGAVMGAGFGATEPVTGGDYWSQKGMQTAVGAAGGAAVPAAWEGAKALGAGVRNVAQPYVSLPWDRTWGADRAAGRLLNDAAGSRRAAVLQSLEQPNTIVPGSAPTAGQAAVPAGSAEFAAMQRIAEQRDPSAYMKIGGDQNAARIAALRTIGQTPADLESAIAQRGANANVNYGQAYNNVVKANPELARLMSNPYVKDEVGTALKLAEANGITPKNNLTEFLHYVKIGLDKQLSKTGNDALSSTQQKAVQDAKTQLVDWMSKANPQYDAARAAFAAESKPINQMQIGQEIEKKLVPALGEEGKQKAAAYAQALREAPATIKRATGQPRYEDLADIMTPQQMQTLGNVKSDLARNATYESMAKEGMPAASRAVNLAAPEIGSVGMFSPKISVARSIYNRVTGHATDKILNDLASRMTDPIKTAEIMRKATPFERKLMVDLLMKQQAAIPAAMTQGQSQ